MHFGTPYASGFGSFQNMLKWDRVEAATAGRPPRVYFEPSPGFEDAFFGVYLNGIKQFTYAPTVGQVVGPQIVTPVAGVQSIQIVRQGHSADADVSRYCRQEESETAARATLSWVWPLDFVGPVAAPAWLSAWTFSGVSAQALSATEQAGRLAAAFSLTVDTGIATVAISRGGEVVSSGSGAVGTTITLAACGDYGFSGTVAVDVSAVDETGTLQWRTLSAMRIRRGGLQVAQVAPNGGDGRWTEPEDLAAASYSYTLRTLSDTGVEGSDSSPIVVDLNASPLPPTAIHYNSGGYAALVVHWTASATALATYNAYVQGPNDPYLDLNAPVALVAGTTSYTLPAQAYPGIVRVLVRAVKAGVEERKGALLDIELDASGVYVAPRPNTPTFGTTTITGATFVATGLYLSSYQDGAPSHLQLFARAPGGTYNYASPVAEAAVVSLMTGVYQAVLTWAGTSGTWECVLKARTSGGVQSEAPSEERQIVLASSTVAAPAFTAAASRS